MQVYLGSMAQEGDGDPVRGSSVYGSTGMYIHILLNAAKSAGELSLTSADPTARPQARLSLLGGQVGLTAPQRGY
jgi:hypothetical protein